LPLVAPLQTLVGSSGATSDHRFTLTTVTLRVGS
jgi:hypothetical protein